MAILHRDGQVGQLKNLGVAKVGSGDVTDDQRQ